LANSDGLKRELAIVIASAELSGKLASRLDELKNQVRLKGFRPGKVPVDHLRRLYGRSVMAEIVQETVSKTNEQAITERKERPAVTPDIKFTEDQGEIERVMDGKADLAYTISYEVIPEIALTDLAAIQLERPVIEVADADTDKGIANLVESSISYKAEAGRKASDGDRVTIDFLGRINGEAFEGGKGEDAPVVIGKGGFIPGFEDGLKGAAAGEKREVKATFPEAYQVKDLAGKEAVFEVTVKEVAAPERPAVDDDFAKNLGAESLANLRELVARRIRQEYDGLSRARLKRTLLDELEKRHDFALPPKLVDNEFEMIWSQVNESLKQASRTFADEGKTEESAREEYRKIAERRVRLGLVLSEIGEKNQIRISEEDLHRAVLAEARRYPGQENAVVEFYRKNPRAMAELRAPLFEDKVVDFVIELAKPAEKKVTREELVKAIEADQAGSAPV
jgi:trigger factor